MTAFASTAFAQTNRIDLVRPDAPELARFGTYAIGVRTLTLTDSNRPDVLNTKTGEETQFYDRNLTVEVWYPAQPGADTVRSGQYHTYTRDPSVMATLTGSAVRDAAPLSSAGAFPLVIISHGYPGNRYLLSHLGENLASKGYIAVSIDHTDSTYEDQQAFASTLYNRSFDQAFVLSAIADVSADAGSFLYGMVDAGNSGLIGFSMGGYGALNNLGAGYSEAGVTGLGAPPNRLLQARAAANPEFRASLDPRFKAGVAIAPWGMNNNFWDAEGLKGLDKPVLFVAGDADSTAGYANGTRAIFEQAVNSDRYLLTFENGGHSVAAPIPLPQELAASGNTAAAGHYMDPVWGSVRSNNILVHFTTAFLDLHLKGDTDKRTYLNLVPHAADGVFAMDANGQLRATHTYWKGFPRGSGIGLILEKGDGSH